MRRIYIVASISEAVSNEEAPRKQEYISALYFAQNPEI
jgi:hypothetical protein